jgi:threonine/homoserine/homoserine lactone efflux protein
VSFADYINIILVFGPVSLLMAMTPGPDFTIVTQQTLQNGKKPGFLTTLGMAAGLLFHAILSGVLTSFVATKISGSIKFIQIFGIIYLFILGVKSFKPVENEHSKKKFEGFLSGLFINILNPKIVIFYLSIVPQFLEESRISILNILFVCSIHIVASIIAMSLLTIFLDQVTQKIKDKRFKALMNKACGVMMILFSMFLTYNFFN